MALSRDSAGRTKSGPGSYARGYIAFEKYEKTRDLHWLNESIKELGEALSEAPSTAHHAVDIAYLLAQSFYFRYAMTGDWSDLESSTRLFRMAAERTPRDNPALVAGRLENFGNALLTCVELMGDRDRELVIGHLQLIYNAFRECAELTEKSHPRAGWRIGSLGVVLRMIGRLVGDQKALDNAVLASREAIDLANDPEERAAFLGNLGVSLVYRFNMTGSPQDLVDAKSAFEDAVRTVPLESIKRKAHISNLDAIMLSPLLPLLRTTKDKGPAGESFVDEMLREAFGGKLPY
jgi:hypothetical protein